VAATSKKIQVVVDETVYGVLAKMSDAGLRGKTVSEVAYKILDEWIWHNQEKLIANGISCRSKRKTR
jgi:hypothetical protein